VSNWEINVFLPFDYGKDSGPL